MHEIVQLADVHFSRCRDGLVTQPIHLKYRSVREIIDFHFSVVVVVGIEEKEKSDDHMADRRGLYPSVCGCVCYPPILNQSHNDFMDDFDFGASVWASSSSQTPASGAPAPSFASPSQSDPKFQEDAFGDDDFEFNVPIRPSASAGDDDDFGDFGDFGDALEGDVSVGFVQPVSFSDEGPFTLQSTADWEALRLRPLPSHKALKAQIEAILEPLSNETDASEFLTNDDIRQVGGLNQILVTPERYVGHLVTHAIIERKFL